MGILSRLAVMSIALCACDPFSAAVEEVELCIPKDLSLPGFDTDGLEASFTYTFPLNISLPASMVEKEFDARIVFGELRAYPDPGSDLSFIHGLGLSIRSGSKPWRTITQGPVEHDSEGLVVAGTNDNISAYVLNADASIAADISAVFPADDWSTHIEFCFSFRLTYH